MFISFENFEDTRFLKNSHTFSKHLFQVQLTAAWDSDALYVAGQYQSPVAGMTSLFLLGIASDFVKFTTIQKLIQFTGNVSEEQLCGVLRRMAEVRMQK